MGVEGYAKKITVGKGDNSCENFKCRDGNIGWLVGGKRSGPKAGPVLASLGGVQ